MIPATTQVSNITAQTALTIHEGHHSRFLYLIKEPSLLPSEFLVQRPELHTSPSQGRGNHTILGCTRMDVLHMLCMDLGHICPHKCMNKFASPWDP